MFMEAEYILFLPLPSPTTLTRCSRKNFIKLSTEELMLLNYGVGKDS